MRRVAAPLILVPTSERVAPGGAAAPGEPIAPEVTAWRRALWRSAGTRPGQALLPAYERYTGVVWEWLDPSTLPVAARRRLLESVVVVSPTHGLLAAGEPVGLDPLTYADRLADGTTVAAYWRARLPAVVESLAAGRPVWNLLPTDHAAAVRLAPGPRRWSLRVERAGRVVSYDSKAVKGAVVRALLTSGRFTPASLRALSVRGYALGDVAGETVRMVAP